MKEKFRPQPENPKHNAPEPGAGPLGIPPPDPEQTAQGGGSKRTERQPLPSVWEILEQKVKLDLLAIDVDDDLNNKSNKEYDRQQTVPPYVVTPISRKNITPPSLLRVPPSKSACRFLPQSLAKGSTICVSWIMAVSFFCCNNRFVHIHFKTMCCTRKPLFYE